MTSIPILVAATILGTQSPQPSSEVTDSIKRCASEKDDAARLACYDQLAASGRASEPKNIGPPQTKWQSRISTDPLTDQAVVALALIDDAKQAMLVLRCANHQPAVFINWNNYLGSEAVVTSRLGGGESERQEWGLSTDKKASFYPGNPSTIILQLMKVDQFVAQVVPYSDNPVTAIFDVRGLGEVAMPLMEECGIK